MARLNVNPTRMELTRLKNTLATTKRGHKLLKDKQDEMIRQYMLLVKENRSLRLEVEKELSKLMKDFNVTAQLMSDEVIAEALMVPSKELSLDIGSKHVMNMTTPSIKIAEESKDISLTYSFLNTSAALDLSVINLSELLPKLIKLAEIEKTCDMLAVEIEKTRRRVNAIEFVMIPSYIETIHFITLKLDDNERSNTIRLMKSKEIIMQKNNA